MAQNIPLLVGENYRDGLRRYNKATINLPNAFRNAWLEDDAHQGVVSQLKLIHKAARHRAKKALAKEGIALSHIVSIVSYLNAAKILAAMGYKNYQNLTLKLEEQFPKVKKYIT